MREAKDCPGQRHQRQAHADRIAGDRAGVVRRGVEKQVGQRQPRHVVRRIDAAGEKDPRRIDAGGRGAQAQIDAGPDVVGDQPQHRAVDPPQDLHPGAEHLLGDLVVVGEAAEHETIVRQPGRRRGVAAPIARLLSLAW